MGRVKKSKTSNTYFSDIPNLPVDEQKFKKYHNKLKRIAKKHEEFLTKDKKLAHLNTKYQKYLAKNPYKVPRKELQKEVEGLKKELMAELPKPSWL